MRSLPATAAVAQAAKLEPSCACSPQVTEHTDFQVTYFECLYFSLIACSWPRVA